MNVNTNYSLSLTFSEKKTLYLDFELKKGREIKKAFSFSLKFTTLRTMLNLLEYKYALLVLTVEKKVSSGAL